MALNRCVRENGFRLKTLKKYGQQNKRVFAQRRFTLFTWQLKLLILKTMSWFKFFYCLFSSIINLLPDWFCALFRFCPGVKQFGKAETFWVVGHRGNAVKAVGNTIPACDLALNVLQANAVEIDLCFTKDNEIILWHDWDPNALTSLARQMGLEPEVRYRPFVPQTSKWRKAVSRLTLQEMRDHYGYTKKHGRPKKLDSPIPTLKEFFNWAAKQTRLQAVFLDIKIPPAEKYLAAPFIDAIAELRRQFNPPFKIIFLSPEKNIIETMKNRQPAFHYSLDVMLPLGIVIDPASFSAVQQARTLHNCFASVGKPTAFDVAPWSTYHSLIAYDRTLMIALPGFPEKLFAWTINKRRELKCLVKMGVDGILTDRPKRLRKIAGK